MKQSRSIAVLDSITCTRISHTKSTKYSWSRFDKFHHICIMQNANEGISHQHEVNDPRRFGMMLLENNPARIPSIITWQCKLTSFLCEQVNHRTLELRKGFTHPAPLRVSITLLKQGSYSHLRFSDHLEPES